ncbi:N-acyl-D-amino-acid deacylase family protein [Actinomadura macrotermitis]|uniref:N-acyl-D-glutamate deacylase n=1 Tax=Actinomadura macrotermitis TaxID=2585200 RepID=A0A7K0BXT2_9ACTN|nr:D-aminoacylase [Actinomadura macrotermitis]MQY05662.1 N-acyl-D-glutamate deacylase [Actinomadura macrotermitis]
MADLLFRSATVVDGTGAPARVADVAVTAGRIESVGEPATGRRVVDAAGLVLAPGFIDMHAHSDLALLTDPGHEAKVAQGVTTEVIGQDGLSYAPADDRTLPQIRQAVAGWNGDPPGFDWNWRSVGEYLDRLDAGIAVNAAYLVPQGTVRMLVMGWDARPPTGAEMDRQRELVAAGLREGAVGMSSGLTYAPGMYASADELHELCRVVAEHGGYYSPHHRSYGAGALEAYAEMIELSRRSGCPLHLAHATMNFEVNRGRAGELLKLLDDALAAGCDITLDTYPYLPGSTTLAALLPSWASEGGPAAILARLADPAARARIRHDLEVAGSDGCQGVPVDWETIEISGSPDPAVVGRTVAGLGGFDACCARLIADDLSTTILQHVGNEENVRAIMRHPAHTGGSDGLLPLINEASTAAKPHPRAWGTFPRYLGHYVRDLGVLSLEECVAHLTGRPARRLGLTDRGVVRPGARADLVLFDPARVRDTATFAEPRRRPEGIPHVLVNGVFVIDDGRPTGALPGRSLRRGGEQGGRE